MADRLSLPNIQVFDDNGDPLAGAKLYFYTTGTSTPEDTYSDSDLSTPNANPVVADASGRLGNIFLDPAVTYKAVLKTSAGVTVWTMDPVAASAATQEASQAQVDARTATTVYVSPAKIADGVGLQGSSIASAAALNIPDVGDYFNVTGTTNITSIESRTAGREITLVFAAALTLTHNATSLILRGTDLKVVAGDVLRFRSEGSGNWRLVAYSPSEEGSWTPAIGGDSTAGTQTYNTQVGRYVRHGNLVTFWGRVTITAKDAATAGNLIISGLPFTSSNVSGLTFPVTLAQVANIDLSAGKSWVTADVVGSGTNIRLFESGDNTASAALAAAALQATTSVVFNGTYRIN